MERFRFYDTDSENEKSAPAFPFSLIQVPSVSLEAIQPEGWTVEEFGPHIRGVQAALEADDLSLIDVPEGLTAEQMVESVEQILVFAKSGAALISDRQKIVREQIELIEAQSLARVLVRAQIVLDADFHIVEGLPVCWALKEMGYDGIVPVLIRLDAQPYAGLDHIQHLMGQYGEHRANLDYDRIQELIADATPEERELLARQGYYPTRETVELRLSRGTFTRLGELITKQLGYEIERARAGNPRKKIKRQDLSIKFDPAQLLYVDALREQITAARRRELPEAKDPEFAEKLQRHLDEEKQAAATGEKFLVSEGERWERVEPGVFTHWIFPRYRFRLIEEEPTAVSAATEQVSPYLMELSQFRIFAKAHFGLAVPEADALHSSEGADGFNRRLRHYIDVTPTVYRVKKKSKGPELDKPGVPKRMELSDQEERLARWNSAPKD